MRSQSLVNRLLAVSLFSASCLGTLALFGSVPMLPRLTARLATLLPDLSNFASEETLPERATSSRGAWIAELPDQVQSHSVEMLRYRVPR